MTPPREIMIADLPLDLDELVPLARRCWEADGGLPLATEPWFLRSRWSCPGTTTFTVRGPSSESSAGDALRAAIAVRPGPRGPMITGLVDPTIRGRGVGSRLLDAALAAAAGNGSTATGFVTVETEGLSPDAVQLFESRGLRQFFAEEVMRIDLAATPVPDPVWPSGTRVAEWSGETAARFFEVYAAAFRERPGFPDPSAEEWIEETVEDDDFEPERSLLATLPEIGDAGFVSVGDNWIQQVGVVPAARRAGLGGALIREALHRMANAGLGQGWLCVNVDNPAESLYRRIGFESVGRRARFRPTGS